jgi:hypothetical protein
MNKTLKNTHENIVIISHLDEVICTMYYLDVDKLGRILERDRIVNNAEFIKQSGSKLEFKINSNNTLRVDVQICKIE